MDVSISEAESRLAELIRAFESGEQVVITRDGKAVAQLAPGPLRAARSGSIQCGAAFT